MLPPGIEPGALVPQTSILSIKLRERARNQVEIYLHLCFEWGSEKKFLEAARKENLPTGAIALALTFISKCATSYLKIQIIPVFSQTMTPRDLLRATFPSRLIQSHQYDQEESAVP